MRAYDPGRRSWVQWAIDNRGAPFERLEGVADADGIDLASDPGTGGPLTRETLARRADGKVVWERETSTGAGRVWKTVAHAELTRRD